MSPSSLTRVTQTAPAMLERACKNPGQRVLGLCLSANGISNPKFTLRFIFKVCNEVSFSH